MDSNVFGAGASAVSSGVNAGLTFGINMLNNKWAAQREGTARKENFDYNEQSAENADARTRALYNDLYSPQAQMAQIKAAGLSPSLFYGDLAGTAGQAGAQGAGATGIQPTVFGAQTPTVDLAMSAKLLSEARLNETKADTESGNNERGRAEIDNLYQDTAKKLSEKNLNEAKAAVENSQHELNELQIQFQNETFWANVAHVEAEIRNLDAQTNDIQNAAALKAVEHEFQKETYDERIKQFKQQGVKLGVEILGIKKNTELAEAEIEKTYDSIARAYIELELERDKINVSKDKNKVEREKIAADNYNKKMERETERLKLKLWRRKIEIEHADRKAKMFISVVNNLISTAGAVAGAKVRQPEPIKKKTTEHYNPNGTTKGWDFEYYE